jgi:hypothetical protein
MEEMKGLEKTVYKIRRFMICTLHQILLGNKTKKVKMSGACSMQGDVGNTYSSSHNT